MAKAYQLKRDVPRQPREGQIDYRAELNEQQWAAVTSPKGPALVIAGAGAGKTRTLTYRVAYLLEQGIPPECILLLTFTNKAAREMMQRVGDLLGAQTLVPWGGTFHSIGARMLRRHCDRIGFQPDFTIMDREDATQLLKLHQSAGIDIKAAVSQSQGSGRYPLLGHQPAMHRRTHPGKPISLLQSSCRRNGTRAASVLPGGVRQKTT